VVCIKSMAARLSVVQLLQLRRSDATKLLVYVPLAPSSSSGGGRI
jgi:hypothetical protein